MSTSSLVSVDLVIKLGGSAITVKNQFETINQEGLEAAVDLIKLCFSNGRRCVVIHGAGSFGHMQAKQYSVKAGYRHLDEIEAKRVKKGFSLARISVTKLNQSVVESLVGASVPAVSVSPCSTWRMRDCAVEREDLDTVRELLCAGFVPVLHGDGCLDSERGCTILSGDTIILTICQKLKVGAVVFLTDVDGVFDKPPTDAGAFRLKEIVVKEDGGISSAIKTRADSCDVTGGIELKLQTATRIVSATKGDTPVFVCRVDSPVARRVCLGGVANAEGEGTTLRLAQDID